MEDNAIPVFSPPVEPSSIVRTAFHDIENNEMQTQTNVDDLIRVMYQFEDRKFYLFFKKGEKISSALDRVIAEGIILAPKIESYFYRHPKFENDFIRIAPDKARWDWEKEAQDSGEMYCRRELFLSSRARAEMALKLSNSGNDNKSPFFFKPSFYGIGVDIANIIPWLKSKGWIRKIIDMWPTRK